MIVFTKERYHSYTKHKVHQLNCNKSKIWMCFPDRITSNSGLKQTMAMLL